MDVEVLIVGAGVIGLAVAREAALRMSGPILVVDRHDAIGSETSSRNSEVIHAGIYYEPGSIKAKACIEGRRALYDFTSNAHVPVKRCGKYIVATEQSQIDTLARISERARINGVDDLQYLELRAIRAREPELGAVAGLYSPSTGIIDSHAYMMALLGEATAHDATLALNSPIEAVQAIPGGWAIYLPGDVGPSFTSKCVVNAAGLFAPALAARISNYPEPLRRPLWYAKGTYCSYSGKVPFSSLVYPVPQPGGLGVHLTIDMANRARFGPNVEWISEIDYSIDQTIVESFAVTIGKYWPEVDRSRLYADYSGIRPKVAGPGDPDADFVIEGCAIHGLPGLVNMFGIESPGITASLALARRAVDLL